MTLPLLVRRAALGGAVLSLALLALRPGRTVPIRPGDAILVTPGAREPDVRRLAESLGVSRVLRLAGRDSLPDAGFVARHFGDARRLHVVGWGLTAAAWRALGSAPAGIHPSPPPAGFTVVDWPERVILGDELHVRGTVSGASGATVSLRDERGVVDSVLVRADGYFALRYRPTAVGRQRLTLDAPGFHAETLGVVVAPPPRWRTLILTAAPSFEAAALRDLLGRTGAPVAWRAGISRGRTRTEFVNRRPASLEPLRDATFAQLDLLVTDGRAFEALSAAERAAALRAVADSGLGLVLLADERGRAASRLGFSLLADTALSERLVRPRTADGPPAASPVPAEPYALRDAFGTGAVLWGAAGDVLAQVMPRGAGRVVFTVVAAPGRWLRAGERRQFAAYWTALLGAAAGDRAAESWSVSGARRVGEPLEIARRGAPALTVAIVTAPGGARDTVYLAADPRERAHATGRYWPRAVGWHEIADAGDAGAFYVAAARAWPAQQAAERLAATARWAAQAPRAGPEQPSATTRRPIPPVYWLALFVLSAGVLWADRRRAYIRAMPRTAVAVLVIALATWSCSKSEEERRNDVDRCAAVNTQAELIALCLTSDHKWKDAAADSAARLKQHELDSARTAQEAAIWNSDSARHKAALRECGKSNDMKECLLVRYGWPQDRATRTADSAWQRNAAQHAREVTSCRRGRNPVASCLMLNYKWNAQRAMATEDSLRRLRLR
jgi:hypothetical protein